MSKIMKYKFLATALVAALATPAFATEGYYVGASGGEEDAKDFDDVCDDLGSIGFVGSCDETDNGWKIFGGYQFTPNWGLEVFYADLGEAEARGTAPDLGVPVSVSVDAEVDGFGASAVGTWPINDKFSVFGKVGFFTWDLNTSLRGTAIDVGVPVLASIDKDDDGTDLTYGIGAQYSFNETFAIRVEWERFDDVGDAVESDFDFLSAGIVLSF